MKRTDFFIAGNSKSGTTALYKFLEQHPEICMSEPKEPNFFAADFCHEVDVGAFTRKSLAEYHSFFDDESQSKLWGEASACYMYSKVAAREIYAYNPEAKIIIILREPVSFLHSYHLQMLKNVASEGEDVKDFKAALDLEEERKHGRRLPEGVLIPELLYYAERVKYAEQVGRFMEYFDSSQLKVLIYDDFKADNAGVLREMLAFLNVDLNFKPTLQKYNEGEKLRSKTMQTLMHDLTHGEGFFVPVHAFLKRLLPKPVRRYLIHQGYDRFVFQPKPAIAPELRAELMTAYKQEVEKVSRLLDRDLVSQWGYNQILSETNLHAAEV